MNSKEKGELAEAKVISRLMELGYAVSIPFGENEDYDLICDDDGDMSRVQVKCGRSNGKGSIITELNRVRYNSNGSQSSYYEDGSVDAFIIHHLDTDTSYWFDADEVSKTSIYIRMEEPERWTDKINWHEDYQL